MGFDAQHEPAVFTATGRQTWSTFVYGYGALTTVTAGHYLFKGEYLGANLANGRGSVRLTAQPDGNMVVGTTYGTVLWSTRTAGHPNAYLSLQTDGNLVVHAANGAVLWANYAHATGARLVAQSDGNVVEYASNGTAVWSTRTHA